MMIAPSSDSFRRLFHMIGKNLTACIKFTFESKKSTFDVLLMYKFHTDKHSIFLDGNFTDGLMLHVFPKNYKHPSMPFFAIKWAIFDAPGPVSARDVCWLEYGDIRQDEDGKEFGFGVVSLRS